MTSPIHLVDASIYVFRGYFSLPDTFVSSTGESINAVTGYTGFLLDLLAQSPAHISLAFDESLNTCYRNEIYPAYKANREPPDANLSYQFEKCREITGLLGLHYLSLKHYEADDIIGTLQRRLAKRHPVVIVTRDKDLGQLLRDEDVLWDFAADDYSGPADIRVKFGVTPAQLPDYLALAGDTVDNIPGAPGVGAKTAAKILSHFGDIDSLYRSLDELPDIGLRGAARVRDALAANEERVRLFREITKIRTDIELEVRLDDLKPRKPDRDGIERFCNEMNFGRRLRDRLGSLS